MKTNAHHHRRQGGFTLVVTMMMMMLLAVIVVGLLSLSTIAIRGTASTGAETAARANARLALMIAIGNLQKSAGPDRRITATADLRTSSDQSKKHWTGVWSTEGWDPTHPEQRTFVSWLTSDAEARAKTGDAALAVADSPLRGGGQGSRLVKLVGKGTLGGTATDQQVELFSLPIHSGDKQTGGLAYWVGDEGVKARYDLTEPRSADPNITSARWAATARSGIQKIPGMQQYSNVKRERVASTISFDTIPLSQDSRVPDGLFHDVTTDSEGLTVDVRNGGPRHDLSLAFELPLDDFNALTEFHDSNETNNTNWYSTLGSTYSKSEFYPGGHQLGYVFQIPVSQGRLRGPTWDLLRNHARLYKNEWEDFSWPRKQPVSSGALEARGSLPMSYASIRYPSASINGRWGEFSNEGMTFGKPIKGQYVANETFSRAQPYSPTFDPARNTLRRTAEKITPIVTRVTFALGIVKGTFPFANGTNQESIAVSLDPYFTILNPYNKPIEFYSIGFFCSKFNPFNFDLSYKALAGNIVSQKFDSSDNTYNKGSFSFRLDSSSSGGVMRLEPGEMKVISPKQVAGGFKIDRTGATPLAGIKTYQEDSGIVIPPTTAMKPPANSQVTLKVRGRDSTGDKAYQANEADSLTFSLFLPKLHDGKSRDVVTDLPPVAEVQINTDAMDDPLIERISFTTVNAAEITKSVNNAQIPQAGQAGFYVAALDMWMKDFNGGDRPVLAQFNPRASAFDPRDYDGSDRVSPAWNAELFKIGDISELSIVTGMGLGRWGGGLGGGGAGGTSYLCLYDIPRAPLTSLASFQHADVGAYSTDAPYAIGNSFPPPSLKLDSIAGSMPLAGGGYTDWNGHSHMDVSWAANEMLWDHYFLSGLAWGNNNSRYRELKDAVTAIKEGADVSPFANPRLHLTDKEVRPERLEKHDSIGDQLSIRGAFNINSTSVNAWKAVLSGLDQVELAHLSNGSQKTGRFNVPVSRFSMPAGGDGDQYLGFKSLDDSELEQLAKAIVDEVRARGPFMGLSDFVNRRLENGKNGNTGALQAAIDKSRINSSYGNFTTAGNVINKIDSTEAGIPGYVMQSDLLTTIGSFISARSDTFKIRAYGEATDAGGKVLARAWCEAIVQRSSEWIEPTAIPATIPNPGYPAGNSSAGMVLRPFIPNPAFPEPNTRLGRGFKLASFRWLSSDEV